MASKYLDRPVRPLSDLERAEAARAKVVSIDTFRDPPLPPRLDIPTYMRRKSQPVVRPEPAVTPWLVFRFGLLLAVAPVAIATMMVLSAHQMWRGR